jgi:hypothetical protein
MPDRLFIFRISLGVEGVRFHCRPRIFRILAATTSPGMSFTLPSSISLSRRRASSPQAFSISGSGCWALSAISCSMSSVRSP